MSFSDTPVDDFADASKTAVIMMVELDSSLTAY